MSNSDVKRSIGFDIASGSGWSAVSIGTIAYDGVKGTQFITWQEHIVLKEKTEGCLWVVDERKVEDEKGSSGA